MWTGNGTKSGGRLGHKERRHTYGQVMEKRKSRGRLSRKERRHTCGHVMGRRVEE